VRCPGFWGCCSNNEIQNIPLIELCGTPDADYSESTAFVQHELDGNVVPHNCQFSETSNVAGLVQISLCHFDGHSVDNLQLQLSPNASVILDSMNRQDERV
jgi:hypothetical protein